MKKVIFLGAKDIGVACLKELFLRQVELNYKIIAVLTSPRGEGIRNFCKKHDLAIFEHLDDILEKACDILFSVQYHQILSPRHIKIAKEIAFNLHLAPLPEYRGCNQFSFALLNDDKEFGVTIHRLEKGIDSGAIVFEKRFDIPSDCFVDELVKIASQYGFELFSSSLPALINGNYELIPQSSRISHRREFHLRREIDSLKCIDIAGGHN